MNVVDRGIIFTATPPHARQSCQYGSLCVLPSGRWLCAIRTAPTKDGMEGKHAILTWSDDQGRTWNAPTQPWSPPKLDGRAGVLFGAILGRLTDNEVIASLYWVDYSHPELPFFNEQTTGILDCQVFTSRSTDQGVTWSAPLHVKAPFDQPVPPCGPIQRFSTGELALPIEPNKPHASTAPAHLSSAILFSTDGGRTWPRHSIAAADPTNKVFYGDQRAAVLPGDRLLDYFWTYDNEHAKYLNIHGRESNDAGRTWSPLFDTGVFGQPATPVALRDGRIALVFVDRTGSPAIRMRASADGGKTFAPETLTIYDSNIASQTITKGSWQDALAELKKFSVGLPQTALLPDGDVLVSYYAGPHSDQTEIQWARVRL
jgi:hypothetical protein